MSKFPISSPCLTSVRVTGRRCTAFLPRQGRCDSVSFRPAHELPTRLSCEQAWRALLSIQSRHGLWPLLSVPLGTGIGIYSIWVLVQEETEKLFGPCC